MKPANSVANNLHRPSHSILRQSVIQRSDNNSKMYTASDVAKIIYNYRKEKNPSTQPSWPEINKIPDSGKLMLSDAMKSSGVTLDKVRRAWRELPEISQHQVEVERGRELERRREVEDQKYRRKESIARLLETPQNICVAMTILDGKIYAACNMGDLAQLAFDGGELKVGANVGLEKDEGELGVKAKKLSAFLTENPTVAGYVSQIIPVEQTIGGSKHAEMKILDFLYACGKKGTVKVYISRLCCVKCRFAIDLWNQSQTGLTLDVREGTHGSAFPGWIIPDCFRKERLVEALLKKTGSKSEDDLFGKNSVCVISQRRSRSKSPAPDGRWTQL